MINTPVVILCGGRGMRLNERTESIPKPMVEIGGMPVLWHVMKIFASQGCRKFVLCLGYRGEKIREFFVDYPWRTRDCRVRTKDGLIEEVGARYCDDWEVTLADTGQDVETGERLLRASCYLADAETFFLTYADGLSDISVLALRDAHRDAGRVATVTCVRPRTHFGTLDIGPDGLVAAYREKVGLPALVNGGFFCLDRAALGFVQEGEAFEREPLQRLVAARQLGGYEHPGYWACMDTFKDNVELNDLWTRGAAPWKIWR